MTIKIRSSATLATAAHVRTSLSPQDRPYFAPTLSFDAIAHSVITVK
jgi:hypothetical protein